MKLRLLVAVGLLAALGSTSRAGSGRWPAITGSGGGGGSGVDSVSNGGGCLVISPTTGAVVITSTACLETTNNLSDLTSASTARTNLGLGTAAVQNVGAFLQVANNLSDLSNVATAITNLGIPVTSQRIPFGNGTALTSSASLKFDGNIVTVAKTGVTSGSRALVLDNEVAASTVSSMFFQTNGTDRGFVSFGTSLVSIGVGAGGATQFQVSSASTNVLFGYLQDGDLGLGDTAHDLVTSTTVGFVWTPSMLGVPTGVPAHSADLPNSIPTVVDRTNKRSYAYIGGAWHYAAFDDGATGNAITALTGDVTAAGPGSVSATIASNAVTTAKINASAVTYAKIQTQADQTILGNVSGGTAVPSALSVSQVLTALALPVTVTRVPFGTGTAQTSSVGFTFTTATSALKIGNSFTSPGSIQVDTSTAGGISIGGGITAGIYVKDQGAGGEANIAADTGFFAQRLVGFQSLGFHDLQVGTATGNVLRLQYLMDRVGSGTDALTVDGTSGAIATTTATTINGSLFAPSTLGGVHVDALGNVRIGKDATLATNATDGFPYMPRISGAPTGAAAASFTAGAPFVYDQAQERLWIRDIPNTTWEPIPTFSSTAGAGAQVGTLTNLPTAVASTTTKYWLFKDAAGVNTYVPFWQ